MSAEGKVSLNASQYKKTLDDIKGKTSKTFDDVGKNIGKAGQAVGAFSSEVSGKFGALSKIIGALTNPITLVIAGFGALLSAGKELYDVLTVSSEEYLQKVEKTAKEQKKQYDEMKTAQEAEQGYMERLKELGEKENKTNEEKEEMIFLVNTLTAKYGDLGIEIDGVTGKLQNLAQAEGTLNVKQKEARAKQLEDLIKTERKRGEKYYGQHLDSGVIGTLDEWLGNNRLKVQDYRNKDTAGRLAFAQKSFDAATTKKNATLVANHIFAHTRDEFPRAEELAVLARPDWMFMNLSPSLYRYIVKFSLHHVIRRSFPPLSVSRRRNADSPPAPLLPE